MRQTAQYITIQDSKPNRYTKLRIRIVVLRTRLNSDTPHICNRVRAIRGVRRHNWPLQGSTHRMHHSLRLWLDCYPDSFHFLQRSLLANLSSFFLTSRCARGDSCSVSCCDRMKRAAKPLVSISLGFIGIPFAAMTIMTPARLHSLAYHDIASVN